MDNLLARFAENAFWMGRYMERAENLARILDVNESFARGSSEEEVWLPILRLHGEEEAFLERHDKATAREVVHYYTLERASPNSIRSCLDIARDNARTMRHLISTEMWRQLNVFHTWLCSLTRRDIRIDRLSRVCAQIKENCQTHAGILEGTLHRDQFWHFYQLGKAIERAGQTTRLIDIKSHLLTADADDYAAIDIAQWNALLRSAAGYHAFRRIYPRGMNPQDVADFMFLDRAYPRSVACSIHQVDSLLYGLRRNSGLNKASEIRIEINPLLEELEARPYGDALRTDLGAYVDRLQIRLDDLATRISAMFFR